MYDASLLGENIKKHRRLAGLTQSELANRLFLTAQNVSKWETGKSAPDVNNLCLLAKELGISVEALLCSAEQEAGEKFMIAIDGGGTKTEFCLFTESGKITEQLILNGSNPNAYGKENACETLRRGLDKLLASAPSTSAIYAGIAGCGLEANRLAVMSFLKRRYPGVQITVDGDIPNIIYSTEHHSSCIAVIMGTGSIVCAKSGDEIHKLGGWGYLFDSTYSGFELGRQAVIAALAEEDGSGESTLITQMLKERLGAGVREKLDLIYSSKTDLIGSFSKIVFDAYDKGDALAQGIISKAACSTLSLIETASKKHGNAKHVVLAGGLTARRDILERYFTSKSEFEFIFPKLPPIYGAAVCCMKKLKIESDGFFENFEKSYKRG